MVVAPWFATGDAVDVSQWLESPGMNGSLVRWALPDEWEIGAGSLPDEQQLNGIARGASSFAALDALLCWLLSRLGAQLQEVSVAGFSAGGQLALRWAIFSPHGAGGRLQWPWPPSPGIEGCNASLSEARGRAVREGPTAVSARLKVILGDPGTYTYLSSERPDSSCSPLLDTGGSHRCALFGPPSSTCGGAWDSYKFGLSGIAQAVRQVPYLKAFASNASALGDAVRRFSTKDVRFVFGLADVCNCNTQGFVNAPTCFRDVPRSPCAPTLYDHGCCDTYPDAATSNTLDVNCADMLQGSNRLQRGLNYVGHLMQVFGDEYKLIYGLVVGGHDKLAFLSSSFLRAWAMGGSSEIHV